MKEKLNLDPFVAYYALSGENKHKRNEDKKSEINLEESKKYKLIQSKLIGSDEEDGGWEREAVIQRLSDEKFFSITYQEWDVDWEKGDIENWQPEFKEVFPIEEKIITYK